MAEFPAKVSTQTSTADAAGHGIRFFLRPDMAFLRSIPAILMVVELVFGLLVWALVADSHYWVAPAYGWVLFVALFCWLVTLILFVLLIFQIHKRLSVIPWPMAIFIYHVAATVLYVTAFITCAASTKVGMIYYSDFNKRAAASFFACMVMIAYGASTFFSFTDWRGPGSNAASAQA